MRNTPIRLTQSGRNASDYRRIRCTSRSIITVLAVIGVVIMASAQLTGPLQIGMVAFYGYEGMNPESARAALPFKVGDSIPAEKLGDTLTLASDAIAKAVGSKPTDIEMARWDRGHASSSLTILDRIAGMPEAHINELIAAGNNLEIIQAAEKVSP